jgi:hypothetical protein
MDYPEKTGGVKLSIMTLSIATLRITIKYVTLAIPALSIIEHSIEGLYAECAPFSYSYAEFRYAECC